MHSLPWWCRARASKHVAFHLGLSLNRFEPLAPISQVGIWTMPWGCALGKSACHHPTEGSDATSHKIREEVGKAGPPRSLTMGSLLPGQFLLCCPCWGQQNVKFTYVTRHREGVSRSAPSQEGEPGWQARADLCKLSSCSAQLLTKWQGSDVAGAVWFGASLTGEFKPGVKQGGLDLSVSFPYRQLVRSLLHCCPF